MTYNSDNASDYGSGSVKSGLSNPPSPDQHNSNYLNSAALNRAFMSGSHSQNDLANLASPLTSSRKHPLNPQNGQNYGESRKNLMKTDHAVPTLLLPSDSPLADPSAAEIYHHYPGSSASSSPANKSVASSPARLPSLQNVLQQLNLAPPRVRTPQAEEPTIFENPLSPKTPTSAKVGAPSPRSPGSPSSLAKTMPALYSHIHGESPPSAAPDSPRYTSTGKILHFLGFKSAADTAPERNTLDNHHLSPRDRRPSKRGVHGSKGSDKETVPGIRKSKSFSVLRFSRNLFKGPLSARKSIKNSNGGSTPRGLSTPRGGKLSPRPAGPVTTVTPPPKPPAKPPLNKGNNTKPGTVPKVRV